MSNDNRILKSYELAKEAYADFGIDTDDVISEFMRQRISLHCWQGDDVKGFEGKQVASENVVTGNFPGAATTPAELRGDIEVALQCSPIQHKVSLHAIYAEPSTPTPREKLDVSAFKNWIDWAKEHKVGLDYNGTFFAHEMMDNGMSLASPKKAVRDYWIEHLITSRQTANDIGRAMGDTCCLNTWIPDGMKDNPADRRYFRELLLDSLDKGMAKKYDKRNMLDFLEAKLFGIGSESYVVGSYDFYLAYCAKNNTGICLDAGHFHPTEAISDKLSSLSLFFEDILLHVSRGVRWDSDHVVISDDTLNNIMLEASRAGLLGKLNIGLDYFDASINRIYAWAVGLRAAGRSLLAAMLEPVELLRRAEIAGNYSERLAFMEEAKALPANAVWDMACLKAGVPVGKEWMKKVDDYTDKVISKR